MVVEIRGFHSYYSGRDVWWSTSKWETRLAKASSGCSRSGARPPSAVKIRIGAGVKTMRVLQEKVCAAINRERPGGRCVGGPDLVGKLLERSESD